MSSTTTDVLPPGCVKRLASLTARSVNLFGGLPIASQDFAASIVFIAAWVLLAILGVVRVAQPGFRHRILVKPLLLSTVRIATYVIRAVQSQGAGNLGTFIAEQILILSGGLMLVEPIVQLVEYNVGPAADKNSQERIPVLVKILKLMRMSLIAALVLGIYAGTQYSTDMSQSTVDSVKQMRLAAGGIGVAVNALIILITLGTHFTYQLKPSGTIWLLVAGFFSLVQSAYKLFVQTHSVRENPLALSTKLQYYVLSATMEVIVCTMFLAFALRQLFPGLDLPQPSFLARIGQRFGFVNVASRHTETQTVSVYEYNRPTRPTYQTGPVSYLSEDDKDATSSKV